MQRIIILTFILFCTLISITAQQRQRITGTVTDAETGEELIGVNVTLKGTNQGTITDLQGRFVIESANLQTDVLIFSYVGYVSTEFALQGRSQVDIDRKSTRLNSSH